MPVHTEAEIIFHLQIWPLFLVGMGASISLIACHMRPVWGKDTESNGISALQSEVASVREWLDWAGWDSIV